MTILPTNWQPLVTFRVYGDPKGQPRARAFARKMGNKFVARVYDAGTAESWKSDIAIAGNRYIPSAPITGAIRLDTTFLFPRPQRMNKKSSPPGRILHTSKPDRDNLEKAVMDCMTKIGFWEDDAQVCAGEPLKFFVAKDERPGAEICISILPADPVANGGPSK